jgi:DNA gyrase subunit B
MTEYGAGSIKVLKGLEGVRKRPEMYIGDTSIKGLHHLIYEVVDNSIDESMAGFCNNIKIELTNDGSAIIEDNGRGIPVATHPTENMPAATVVLTILHAGGKFNKESYKVSGGLHGVGVSVVNALSSKLHLTIYREENIYEQWFKEGIPTTELSITGSTKKRGTKIEFWPDKEIFTEGVEFKDDILSRRFKELAYLNPKIYISFRDQRKGFKQKFHFEGGIKQFVEDLQKRDALSRPVLFRGKLEDIEIDMAFMYQLGDSDKLISFANNIKTSDGGTHESGFRTGLTRAISNYISKNASLKDRATKISGDDTKEGLIAVLSVKIPEPRFESQTKGKLVNSYVRPLIQKFTYEKINKFLEENPIEARAIVNQVILAAKGREAAKRAKDLIKRKDSMGVGTLPGKLADCQSKDPKVSELYLVEGDSAGGCFVGDTKVALADGRDLTFLELIEEYRMGKRHLCYTIKSDGSIGVEKILYPRLTKVEAPLVEITLDSGEKIRSTPEHRFMRRDGSYVQAVDLKDGESLMPLYRREVLDRGSEVAIAVLNPKSCRWVSTSELKDSRFLHSNSIEKYSLDFDYSNTMLKVDSSSPQQSRYTECNHKVVSVKMLDRREDVYDIEVPNSHNFALASGIFVHNSAKQGRDRAFQAILPLKGKILNVEKARLEKVLKSEEIKNIITALGCGIADEFDETKVRYHKIVIMTDADVDGSHIQTLLMTFFFRFFRQIIENGYLYLAQPPLYRYKKGKSEIYLKDDKALNSFLIKKGIDEVESKSMRREELIELFKLVSYYHSTLKEIDKRFSLSEIVRHLIENSEIVGRDNYHLAERLEAYIEKLEYNILNSSVDEEKIHYYIQTKEGLEEIVIDEKLFSDPHYNEALYIYSKIQERITDEFLNRDLIEILDKVLLSAKRGAYIQRYKGLGEMNPEQLWETTMNPENRRLLQVTIGDVDMADETFVLFMGDEVEPRRNFIELHAKDVKHLDV